MTRIYGEVERLLILLLQCILQKKYWDDEHPDGLTRPQQQQSVNMYLLHGVAKYMVIFMKIYPL
jgi:hypothetical protein